MKYRIEYHMNRGGFVPREFDTEEEMKTTAKGFQGSRKGTHVWEIDAKDRKGEIVVPLENVSFIMQEAYDDSEEETEEE